MPLVSVSVLIVAGLVIACAAAFSGWILARRKMLSLEIRRLDLPAAVQSASVPAASSAETSPSEIERLRQLLDVSTDGAWEWRPLDDRWWFSDSLLALYGYGREEFGFNGESFLEWVHEDDRTHLMAQFKNRQGSQFAMEFRGRCKSGNYLWLSQRGEVIERDAQGQPTVIIGTITNIFERLVDLTAKALDVRCCMVMDCTPDHLKLNYVCLYLDGKVSAHRDVTLKMPLFAYTDAQNHLSVRVGKDIHADEWTWLGFAPQFTAGLPLLNSAGERIGYLVLCHDQLLRNPEEVESVTKIFAERASSELIRSRHEREILKSREHYFAFLQSSKDAIWRLDIDPPVDIEMDARDQAIAILRNGKIGECNEAAAQLFDLPSVTAMMGKSLTELVSERILDHIAEDLHGLVISGYHDADEGGHHPATNNSPDRWLTMSRHGIIEKGRLCSIWGVVRDITRLHQHLQKVQSQAEHDSLTGLPNRNHLFHTIKKSIETERSKRFALLLMDLDRFKEINDTLGHHYGDEILKQIAPRVEQKLADSNVMIARLGGDEFALMIPEIDAHKLGDLAQMLVKVIREPYTVAGLQLTVGVSMGGVLYPHHGADEATLVRCADIAMYAAKQRSMGFMLYEPSIDGHSPERLALLSDLEYAIDHDQLALVFQPKVDLRDASCIGVEVLLRWQHPVRGMVSPGMFIPLAETTELIHPLTRWVLTQAIAQWRAWTDEGLDISIAVNISARNLLDDRLPQTISDLLEQYDMEAEYLELEITESAFMSEPQRALTNIERIHAMGVSLSIDDFGTGYSSLSYLKRLPVNTLKIDLGFVRHMLDSEQDATIVRTIIHLAHDLGLKVVAEGVESQEIFEALASQDCDLAQGYHISRPVSASDISDWLMRHARRLVS